MKKFIYILFITLGACTLEPPHYIGKDYRIFRGTIAEGLAEAVIDEDIDDIRRIVIEDSIPVDFQDAEYGHTVLMIAVMNKKAKSVETLLNLGADPNLCSDSICHEGENAIVLACEYSKSPEIVKMLLDHGAKANYLCKGRYEYFGQYIDVTSYPLIKAVNAGSLEIVKMLVEAGANVNGEDYKEKTMTLYEAIVLDHLDIALYLLERGAIYDCDYRDDWQKENESDEKITIMDCLRQCTLEIDSEEYEYKRKVIDFLEARGMSYSDTPIPKYIIKKAKSRHPFTWKEYLEKY